MNVMNHLRKIHKTSLYIAFSLFCSLIYMIRKNIHQERLKEIVSLNVRGLKNLQSKAPVWHLFMSDHTTDICRIQFFVAL